MRGLALPDVSLHSSLTFLAFLGLLHSLGGSDQKFGGLLLFFLGLVSGATLRLYSKGSWLWAWSDDSRLGNGLSCGTLFIERGQVVEELRGQLERLRKLKF